MRALDRQRITAVVGTGIVIIAIKLAARTTVSVYTLAGGGTEAIVAGVQHAVAIGVTIRRGEIKIVQNTGWRDRISSRIGDIHSGNCPAR